MNNLWKGLGKSPSSTLIGENWRETIKGLVIAAFDGDQEAKDKLLNWANGKLRQTKTPRIDLTGRQFEHLTVVKMAKKTDSAGAIHWHCVCSCGEKTIVRGSNLTSLRTTSCGHTRGYRKNQDLSK